MGSHVCVNELFESYDTGLFHFIVKIDSEGAEEEVFSGDRPAVLEMHRHTGSRFHAYRREHLLDVQ